jgi:hypothetical protein
MVAQDSGSSAAPLEEFAIARAEMRLGLRLPPILKAAFHEIGNGGFGPGYGLLPLTPAATGADAENVMDLYLVFRDTDPDDRAWR